MLLKCCIFLLAVAPSHFNSFLAVSSSVSFVCDFAAVKMVKTCFVCTVRDILLHKINKDVFCIYQYVYNIMEYFTLAMLHMLVHDVIVCLVNVNNIIKCYHLTDENNVLGIQITVIKHYHYFHVGIF